MAGLQLKKKRLDRGFPYRRPTNAFGEFVRMQTLNSKGIVNTRKISTIWKSCDEDVKSLCRQLANDKLKTYKELKEKYEVNRLRRPRSGYNLFVQNFVSLNKGLYDKISQTVSEAAKIWNKLDPEEKEKWVEAGRTEREKYYAEKQKRIETGEIPGPKRVQLKKKSILRKQKKNFRGKIDARKRKASASCACRQKKRMLTKSRGLGKKKLRINKCRNQRRT